MFVEMNPSNGGGGDAYTAIPYGYTAYNNRWTYKSGGFRVKDGVCYVNAKLTLPSSLNVNYSLFSNAPKPSSEQGTTGEVLGEVLVKYNATLANCFLTAVSKASGEDISFVGQYLTDAPDSEVQV